MVVQSAQQAKDNANRYTSNVPGMCLAYVHTWLDIPSRDGTAAAAWANCEHKHKGDGHPPPGAPVFWTGGSQGYGHIGLAINAGQNTFRGTDMTYRGQVSTQWLGWIERYWGRTLNYAGWAEDLNGVLIPYLHKPDSQWASGDVWVSKLKHGQKDSDSVARLSYRLRHMSDIPNSHKPPKQGRNYNDEILQAVRYWQKNIAPKVKGPKNGTSMSNAQANKMFGDAYQVHEK